MEQAKIETAKPRPRFSREIETPHIELPPGKQIGAVLAVTRNAEGDLYILHQPNAQGLDPELEGLDCWLAPLVRLSPEGRFIEAWGGPDALPRVDGVSQWPAGVEGLECDGEGNLWIFGYKRGDDAVLKFSPSGELLMRIGQRGKAGDDTDTQFLDRPTSCYHDLENREVFISDGYGNRRVIAFNSDTGEFTRMWGAYGKQPDELSEEESYASPVHKVARGPNGLLYVADRTRSRIQEFELAPGGAQYRREVFVAPGTMVGGTGSCWDVGFSPDGRFIHVADGANFRVWSIDIESLEVLGSTTVHTEHENDENRPAYFSIVHRFFVEANGDLLLACVNRGLKRLKFEGVR
ncbi:MAG: hypothetical protein KDE49_15220 [Novosphingobium sp.]|nr:hypothetical protein [Novosphingobium sp.]